MIFNHSNTIRIEKLIAMTSEPTHTTSKQINGATCLGYQLLSEK